MNLSTIILAAGQGTRMNSKKPKVLHEVAGLPLVEHVIRLSEALSDCQPVVVIGHGAEEVQASLSHLEVSFVLQKEQLGTGHAVMMARDFIEKESSILVLYGDTPLIREHTILDFIEKHRANKNQLSVLSMRLDDPAGYGRILRRKDGGLSGIIEHKDADEGQRAIDEVNSGIYLINGERLLAHIDEIENNNVQKEFYLTDIVEIFAHQGYNVDAYCVEDSQEMLGINTRVQLAQAESVFRKRISQHWMIEGVTIIDPENTYIDPDVTIGQDSIIYPGTMLRGQTIIGRDCLIGPRAVIENSEISDGVHIRESQVIDSSIDENTVVGPYAYIRPGSEIGKSVKIGDFVEIKKSQIGDGTKISHLTYVGDAKVGKSVNLGCGVVFVNYDGVKKSRTEIGDRSFIGCNVNLVAPVTVAEDAYVAAGTTVTKSVPKDSLAIGREKQRNIEGWVSRKRGKR
jgi:bifunctional UDP-N-acetylglucosamine pyrophosphorylase/glucosamine-1-phosphate N-acetyltransferase